MSSLSVILFLIGVVFLILGWRWQSPPNKEAMTALKGLTYLKQEVNRIQDQVHILENKIQTVQPVELKEPDHEEVERREVARILSSLKTEDQRERIEGVEVEPKPKRNISPKYQEVLELAAQGQRIPEIAQHLSLSQDAVKMVLQTQAEGAMR